MPSLINESPIIRNASIVSFQQGSNVTVNVTCEQGNIKSARGVLQLEVKCVDCILSEQGDRTIYIAAINTFGKLEMSIDVFVEDPIEGIAYCKMLLHV